MSSLKSGAEEALNNWRSQTKHLKELFIAFWYWGIRQPKAKVSAVDELSGFREPEDHYKNTAQVVAGNVVF